MSINGEKFVVITDGSQQMNILFIDANDGTIHSKVPVDFGVSNSIGTQSEQSVVVFENKAVVVNNWFNDEDVPMVCHLAKALHEKTGVISDKMIDGCPFLLNGFALGVQQFEFDNMTKTAKSVWSRSDVSCTSSIPVVSEADKTFYCIGNRDKKYTLEALSWESGEQVFFKELGTFMNPFYAGNELGV
jgi:hypothetical protein